MATIKLETNIPLTGTVKYLNYFPERENPKEPGKMMAAQYGFKGTFDGIGEGQVYVNEFQLAADPLHLGMAIRNGERDGIPQFKWTELGKIQLVKREDGRKRIIQLARVGEAPAHHYVPINPPAPSTPPLPRPPALIAQQARTEPAVAAAFAETPALDDAWAALEARYARCVEIAKRIWSPMDYEGAAIVAAAATLLIQAEKDHLPTPISPAPLANEAPRPVAPAAAAATAPTPEQIAQFRQLVSADVLTATERRDWLERLGTHLYSGDGAALAADIRRVQKTLAVRATPATEPATRTAGGPGMPGAGFDEMPTALREGEDLDAEVPF